MLTDFFLTSKRVKWLTLKLPMGWAARRTAAKKGTRRRFINVCSDDYTMAGGWRI